MQVWMSSFWHGKRRNKTEMPKGPKWGISTNHFHNFTASSDQLEWLTQSYTNIYLQPCSSKIAKIEPSGCDLSVSLRVKPLTACCKSWLSARAMKNRLKVTLTKINMETKTIPYHPCIWQIYLGFNGKCVGNYASPMDGMGLPFLITRNSRNSNSESKE